MSVGFVGWCLPIRLVGNLRFGHVAQTPGQLDASGVIALKHRTVNRTTHGLRFDLITPVNIEFGGETFGLPSGLDLTATSRFAISDFEIDRT